MKEKKRLNKNHPDYAEYKKRFTEIWIGYFAKEEKEKAKYPGWSGKDHPADEILRPLHRKCAEETKELQRRYSYLFTEDE